MPLLPKEAMPMPMLPARGSIDYGTKNIPTCSQLTIKCSDWIGWIGSGLDRIGSDRGKPMQWIGSVQTWTGTALVRTGLVVSWCCLLESESQSGEDVILMYAKGKQIATKGVSLLNDSMGPTDTQKKSIQKSALGNVVLLAKNTIF